MKIISKFNDYYDCIQAYGYDDSCQYIRKNKTIKIDVFDYPKLKQLLRIPYGLTVDNVFIDVKILFYCGEIIPYLHLRGSIRTSIQDIPDVFIYSINDIDKIFDFIEKCNDKKYRLVCEERYKLKSTSSWNDSFTHDVIEEIFMAHELYDGNDILIDAHVPLGHIHINNEFHLNTWTDPTRMKIGFDTNISLTNINFYSHKSHMVVFTDIRNYITQQLGGNSPKMVEISNTNKIIKGGFDTKLSFRKAPTKHIKRKKL